MHRLRLAAVLLLLAACLPAGCARERQSQAPPPPERARPAPPPPAPAVAYRPHPVRSAAALRAFQRRLGEERFALVLRVNRVDLDHVRDRDTLQVPEPFLEDAAYAPLPERLAGADSVPKLVLVSLRVQAFAAYEGGRRVRWGPTSTGREEAPTPPGLYHTNWKARERFSTIDGSWLLKWCVNLASNGISMHLYDLPGRPASHSCVRLLEEDARWVHDWCEQWQVSPDGRTVLRHGTPVVIFGAYAFGERPPWQRLSEDPRAAGVAAAEVDSALAAYPPEGWVRPGFDLRPAGTPPAGTAPAVPDSGGAPDSLALAAR